MPEPRSSRLIGYKIVYRDEMSFEEAKFLTVDRVSTIRANLTGLIRDHLISFIRHSRNYPQIWSKNTVNLFKHDFSSSDLRAGAEYSVQIWSDTSVSSQIVVSSVRTVTTLNNGTINEDRPGFTLL